VRSRHVRFAASLKEGSPNVVADSSMTTLGKRIGIGFVQQIDAPRHPEVSTEASV
jgi:hypothetical protein